MELNFIQLFEFCYEGDLGAAQRLFQMNPTINISEDNEWVFRFTCKNGHLHVCQWLLQMKPDINISAENEEAFRWVCYRGYLDLAKWLLQVCPTINISAKNEEAFCWACLGGHLELAKWLLQVSKERGQDIDISAENHLAFRNACSNRYLDVAQWLQSLNPYVYVIEYYKNGKMKKNRIREKKDADWQRRKYLIWLASNHCPEENKNNLLYKLPSDVSRMVIGFV